MPSPESRKRPAPGASPIVPIPISPMQQQQYGAAQPDQLLMWNGGLPDGVAYSESAARSVAPYMMSSAAGQYAQGMPAAPSTALAPRGVGSRALVPTVQRPVFDPSTEPWNTFGDEFQQQPQQGAVEDHESIEALEERALRAKREAQQKRKQIPPFVQKLSSFLDESKNTELIRWSDNGDSFIVIDEDEFAKKLIPELFKHNNYASFVRQLNMYGFHKRVGLSDNSMKASERKNKSPSEYYNPYFKRGHPNLLWLINKPKSGSKKKADKKGDEADSDDDGLVEETYTQPSFPAVSNQLNRSVPPLDLGALPPKKDLVHVKTQLEKLQQQQLAISSIIDRLRREHAQLMNQAVVFQAQHERHENSINAILNFLANVFRKSLEEQGGAQSVSDLLASIIPGAAQAQMPQGNIVDLGDFDAHAGQPQPQPRGRPGGVGVVGEQALSVSKRQPRLLPPIPVVERGKVATVSPSSSATTANTPGAAAAAQYHIPQMGSVTELFDSASPSEPPTTPAFIKNELQTNPHEGMMRIINDTNNATSNSNGGPSRLDLPDMAARTNATMSHEQRSKMLDMMAARAGGGGGGGGNGNAGPNMTVSTPPRSKTISPVLSSLAPPPSLYQIQNTQAEIDALQQMQRDQAAKIDELSAILGPLSPLRHIPGLDDDGGGSGPPSPGGGGGSAQNGYFDAGGMVDMDQFLDPGAFADMGAYDGLGGGVPLANGGSDGNDFDFDVDGGGGAAAGGYDGAAGGQIFEPGSPGRAPSSAGTEEIPRDDLGSPGPKRRRVQ